MSNNLNSDKTIEANIQKFRILKSDDPGWNEYLYKFPESYQDINFTAHYHILMEKRGDGTAELFVYEEDEKIYFHPYMIKPITKVGSVYLEPGFFDIQSVFGYTGPIVNTNDHSFIEAANNIFEEYCKQRGIIAELIRFNPLLENHYLSSSSDFLEVIPLKEYVYLDLTQPDDIIFRNYRHALRKNINQAKQYLNWDWKIVNSEEDFNKFVYLFEKHMIELNVDQYYLNNSEYYSALFEFLKSNGSLFIALDNNNNDFIIAGELLVYNNKTVYFLHSAREITNHISSNVHNYLIHLAFINLKNRGFEKVLIGGGVSDSSEDSLLKFKKKFSKTSKIFYLGKRIFNFEHYEYLNQIWLKEFPHLIDKRKNFVLKYRSVS